MTEPTQARLTWARGTGPYLLTATLVQTPIQEPDGIQSLIRLIHSVTVTLQGPSTPTEMPPQVLPLTFFLRFATGGAKGSHLLSLSPELPGGAQRDALEFNVHFDGLEASVTNVTLEGIPFSFEIEGIYWFDVALNGRPLTRIPFELRYQRLSTSPPL